MPQTVHITNGDCAGNLIRKSGLPGDVLSWQDILHEGPVPPDLSLDELSAVRAQFLAGQGAGDATAIREEFAKRDAVLRECTADSSVTFWFEWDLYDQLQLIQLLAYFAEVKKADRRELNLICVAGYLGEMPVSEFAGLFENRAQVTDPMLALGSAAWSAFRSPDPRRVEEVIADDTQTLPFLADALRRELEEFPSLTNGLSRSEAQLLIGLGDGPLPFADLFDRVSALEDRRFCGDFTAAGYLERMSQGPQPLVTLSSGERVRTPRANDSFENFRSAQVELTPSGESVLANELDWIELGGSDRWLGGVHLDGGRAAWRWDAVGGALTAVAAANE